jgi:carboxylesterase
MRIAFEARKGGTGIVLLHGLTGTPDEVRPLGEQLARRGFSVLIPWLAGHGTSPADLARTTWRDWDESGREALGALRRRCRRVFVGGLSMGACAALHIASHERVDGVVSMAGLHRLLDWRFNLIGFFRFMQWRTSALKGGVSKEGVAHATYDYAPTRSLHELKRMMDHLREDLRYVTAPALVCHGALDSMVPPANADRILEAIGSPVKHRLLLPSSNHVLPLDEDRQVLFEKVGRFMQSGGRKA